MKLVVPIILAIGAITTYLIVSNTEGNSAVLFLVIPPYILMMALAAWINKKNCTIGSHIAVLIAAAAISILKANEYYNAAFNPGSSTAGLVFGILPFVSIFLFLFVYLLGYLVVLLLNQLTGKHLQ